MKIALDPMPALKAAATKAVNEHFNSLAQPHIDAAHRRKREVAYTVKHEGLVTAEFAAEASLRGVTSQQLADVILAKPNAVDQRELARQTILLRIESCRTPAEVTAARAQLAQPV